ncbi:MAG: hypothetical protein ACPGD5_03850 [Salibacteraceae bacterium]
MNLLLTKPNSVLLVVSIITTLVYSYLAYFHSAFYRVELLLIPLSVLVSAALGFIIGWFKNSLMPKRINIGLGINTLILTILIGVHFYESYKPNLTIYLPEDYQGKVHLFMSKAATEEVYVSPSGVGYIPYKGEFDFVVLKGTKDITNVLNESGMTELIRYSADSSGYQSISTSCFEIVEGYKYPDNSWNQKHTKCLSLSAFDSLVNLSIIDTNKIYSKFWTRDGQFISKNN